jgi:hypothetical protein
LLDGLLSEFREAKSGSNMRELLILGPLDVVLGTLIMVVMMSGRPVSKSLLEVKLDLHLLTSGLSPPMVMLEEHVV